MKLSETGLALIKEFEGCELIAYRDAVNVLTIGYGHTGPDVTENLVISQERAEELLRQDVAIFEKGVEELVTVPLTQFEFDALVSFSYNLGLGALQRSTLLKLLNEGKPRSVVANEFPRWNQADGKVLQGLTRRRNAEKALFLFNPVARRVDPTIIAKQDTWLKRQPVQSSTLPAEEKLFVPKGSAHVFTEISILPGKEDYRVTLARQPDSYWWFYPAHWEIKNDAELSTPPSPAPKPVLLKIPYYSQRDNYTDPLRSCFSSSCAMMLKGLKPSSITGDDQYLKTVYTYGDTTEYTAQIKALKFYGVKAEFYQNGSWADIEAQLDKGISVPIGILHKGPVSAPTGTGHWITVIGYTEDKSEYYVHDPYGNLNLVSGGYVSTDGKSLRYSKKNLGPRWLVEGARSGWYIKAFK